MKDINCLGGCSSKLDNKRLQKILELSNKKIKSNEDCSIYELANDLLLVESVDFFPQVSSDLYTYGQITACNSISDIYAMGGIPKFCLSILAVTNNMTDEEIAEIIKGINSILDPLNISIEGGHTIFSKELLCGLNVTGFVEKKDLKLNNTANENDVIVISKPIGFGSIMAAKSVDEVEENDYKKVIKWMTTPNDLAASLAKKYSFTSLTDITGFGLAGHLSELCIENKTANIDFKNLPLVDNVINYLNNYFINGAAANNRRNYEQNILFNSNLDFGQKEIFFDPQTSGGLMGTLSQKDFEDLKNDKENIYIKIGTISKRKESIIIVGD